MGQPKRVREKPLNLSLSPGTRERLDNVKSRINADTYAEVFRRSLEVYDTLTKSNEGNIKIVVTDQDGHVVKEYLCLL